MLTEILREGYRKCAMKYHPDQGGDPEKMLELNRIKRELGF
jgi:DnaJ-class molecular chaperone